MILVVVEQVLAVAVIEMQHQVLVVPLAEAESHIQNCVEIEVPSLAFHKGDIGHPTPVGRDKLCTRLEDTAVLENVLVLLPVDDGNPSLEIHFQSRVNHCRICD